MARPENESGWLETQESRVGSWTGERELVAGEQRGKQQKAVAAGQERGEQQKLAWKNGGAVNTRHQNREGEETR